MEIGVLDALQGVQAEFPHLSVLWSVAAATGGALPPWDPVSEATWGVSRTLLASLPPGPPAPGGGCGLQASWAHSAHAEGLTCSHSNATTGTSVGFSVEEGDTLSLIVCH